MSTPLTPEQRAAALERTVRILERDASSVDEETLNLFFEFRDQHGYEEPRARAAALIEVADGTRAVREIEMHHAEEHGDDTDPRPPDP